MVARRIVAGLVLTLCIAGLLATPTPSAAEGVSREQQIADLERQINELTKRLTELKQTPPASQAQSAQALPSDWVKALGWRCLGPATMGGRITALAVNAADPNTYWVATASGGLLKTTNNGVTFDHQFDREATVSIGAVAVAPSDANIVWVGTGENNPRNSVSYGNGVYKSVDGGKTWANVGLKKTFQTGKILIHPKDPNTVYVGALGRLYGPNEDRGLFKTIDGGKTWNKILYVDDKTGVIDAAMHATEPDTLIVALWERQRDGFDTHAADMVRRDRSKPAPPEDQPFPEGYDAYDPAKKWGPGSGLYKTTDGGKTFHKLTKGLPTCPLGRIGLDWFRKDPKIIFAIVDCEKIGMGDPPVSVILGIQGADQPGGGAKMTVISPDSPAAKAGLKSGDVIASVDKKEMKSYKDLTDLIASKKVGDKLVLTVKRDKETLELTPTLEKRPDPPGYVKPKRPWAAWYGGQRENAQDQQGPNSFEYGGVYKSSDGGESWTRINSLNPRPMYFSCIRVDPSDENHVFVCGVVLYRSADGGKTFKSDGGNGVHADQHDLWIDPRDGRHMLVGSDGGFYATYDRMNHWDYVNVAAVGQFYHVSVDSKRPYRVLGGMQDNSNWIGPSHTLSGSGPINDDWMLIGGGDGFVCRADPTDPDLVYAESQDGSLFRRNLRTNEWAFIRPKDVPGQPPYRYNWNTPFILSQHNPSIFYCGGNVVFRSVKRGEEARPISPEIARSRRGTASALAESPRNPDVLWVGTDDGFLWVTRDGGAKWTNVTDKVGLPGSRWVATIEPSRFAEGRAYVAFDGHRSDDDEPHVYVTEDFGQSWKSIRANLPTGSSRVMREDLENPSLLYAGTEFAVWASVDRGDSWTKINNNLPTVAVHELALHPTAGEMVAATHGRSIWVVDVTALRQVGPGARQAKVTLFRPASAVRWRREPDRGSPFGSGSKRFVGQNPPSGAQIYFALNKKAEKAATIKILDYSGKVLRAFDVPKEPGLHRVGWDLVADGRPPQYTQEGARWIEMMRHSAAVAGIGVLGNAARRPGRGPDLVAPGMYRVVLTVDGEEQSQGLRVEADPVLPASVIAVEEEPRRKRPDGRLDD